LKDALAGNSYTFIIANLSPSVLSIQETIATLYFTKNARKVTNKVIEKILDIKPVVKKPRKIAKKTGE
jgi:hypothetical protein